MADNTKLNDPSRSPLGGHPQPTNPQRLDNELQADPELAEGPASSTRIVAFGVAIVAVLGVVFYGLNSGSKAPDSSTAASTTQSSPSVPPSNTTVADQPAAPAQSAPNAQVSPNVAPGTTTGASVPTNTQQPRSAPTGTEIDSSKAGNNSATK